MILTSKKDHEKQHNTSKDDKEWKFDKRKVIRTVKSMATVHVNAGMVSVLKTSQRSKLI